MTQTAINYAKVLYELNITNDEVMEMKKMFSDTPELKSVLGDPVVSLEQKHRCIDKIFGKAVVNFLKVLCDYGSVDELDDIFQAYEEYYNKQNSILKATLYYVTKPDENQKNKMEQFLMNEYHTEQVELSLKEDSSLIGGFLLQVGNKEYDWSMKARLNTLQQKLVWR